MPEANLLRAKRIFTPIIFELTAILLRANADHVEASGSVAPALLLQKPLRRQNQFLLFATVNCGNCSAKASCFAKSDFYKHNNVFIAHHQVDFSKSRSKIGCDKTQAASFQVGSGEHFGISTADAVIVQRLWPALGEIIEHFLGVRNTHGQSEFNLRKIQAAMNLLISAHIQRTGSAA